MCPHNLQFDGLAIQLDGANLKVHSNGADVALCVGVILQKEEGRGAEKEGTAWFGQANSKMS